MFEEKENSVVQKESNCKEWSFSYLWRFIWTLLMLSKLREQLHCAKQERFKAVEESSNLQERDLLSSPSTFEKKFYLIV